MVSFRLPFWVYRVAVEGSFKVRNKVHVREEEEVVEDTLAPRFLGWCVETVNVQTPPTPIVTTTINRFCISGGSTQVFTMR